MNNFAIVRNLGLQPYQDAWERMQYFTDARTSQTVDEIWLLQHPPVFTQGQAGRAEHLLMPGDIPVIQVDRGGQVTYHGPGQLVMYILMDVRRGKLGVRQLVNALEECIILTLMEVGVQAYPKKDAPGVYVNDEKICSVGLRIRKGCSFHGLAFNIDMDLSPFERINPCGYAGLKMTDACKLGTQLNYEKACELVIKHFAAQLNIGKLTIKEGFDE